MYKKKSPLPISKEEKPKITVWRRKALKVRPIRETRRGTFEINSEKKKSWSKGRH